MKLGGSVPGRILQLFQGLVVDGVHTVVDKAATQKHSQGKDPRVTLRVTLESTFEHETQEFTPKLEIHSYTYSIIFSFIISADILTMQRNCLKRNINTDNSFDNYKDIFMFPIFSYIKSFLSSQCFPSPQLDEVK